MFVFYSVTTTKNYKQLRLETITKAIELATEKVNKTIAELERSAIDLALNGLLYYKSQSEYIGNTSVLENLRSFPTSVGSGIWFEPYAFNRNRYRAGIFAFFDKTKQEVRLDYIEPAYDYHNQTWYREIISEIKKPYQVAWTKPYLDDTSYSLMTTAGAGIYNEYGKLIAISTIDWEIDEVVKQLTEIKPTENSFVLLTMPQKDSIISSTRTHSAVGESLKSIPWDIDADSFKLDNIKYLKFSRYMDNGWLLSIQIPEKEIFAEVEKRNNVFSIIIACIAMLNLYIAYLLISKLINAPIKRLTSDVSQLALGNLDIHIETNSKDELSLLAETFNKMTDDLKESIEENYREHAEKERISAELRIATEIQDSMLPHIFPPFPDRTEFDIYASMLPAKEVGGDFYDFYFIDKNNLVIVIADASGKGIPASLFMVITKTLIKNCSSCKKPKGLMETVNKKLCENNKASMFVTAIVGFYNIPTGKFVYVNAGHNPPLIKKHNGNYEFIRTKPSLVLAWMKDANYEEKEIILEPNDVLYLYTDGVTEAMNANSELFSESRLLEALNKNKNLPPKELLKAIKQEVDIFADGTEQADDITMVALKINTAKRTIKKLEIEAKIENLNKILDFINTELKEYDYPSNLQNDINIAVEEIFANIANYAYTTTGNATLSISAGEKTTITIEDMGKPYNPLEHTDPNLDTPLMEREIGGLGIFLAKKLMDNIEYTYTENKNILTMTKKIR